MKLIKCVSTLILSRVVNVLKIPRRVMHLYIVFLMTVKSKACLTRRPMWILASENSIELLCSTRAGDFEMNFEYKISVLVENNSAGDIEVLQVYSMNMNWCFKTTHFIPKCIVFQFQLVPILRCTPISYICIAVLKMSSDVLFEALCPMLNVWTHYEMKCLSWFSDRQQINIRTNMNSNVRRYSMGSHSQYSA